MGTELQIHARTIQLALENKAKITIDEQSNSIIIEPLDLKTHLEYIKGDHWFKIIIPKRSGIKLVLRNWLFDDEDHGYARDIWCFAWMKDNYNIVDECRHGKYVKGEDNDGGRYSWWKSADCSSSYGR